MASEIPTLARQIRRLLRRSGTLLSAQARFDLPEPRMTEMDPLICEWSGPGGSSQR